MDDLLKSYLRRWLIKAENDLRSAKNDLADSNPITDLACFHAQQCAEKSLKAFIAFNEIHIEKTHYLMRLLGICEGFDKNFAELSDAATELTDYAVSTRYPDDFCEIPIEEAKAAVANAQMVLDFVKSKLERYL